MLMFLASVLDQMDLALEHIQKGSVHDARFGLMLTDNAIELAMHELAKNKHSELKTSWYLREKYQHTKELEEAMGRVFEAKLKFAKLEGLLTDEQARTVALMHDFRNELYHVGLQHEAILPALSRFYFSTACAVLGAYPIRYFGYLVGIQLPERSKKYFTTRGDYSPAEQDDFAKACQTMEAQCNHKKADTIRALADNMQQIVNEQDTNLDIVAEGVYASQRQTRDQATVECQTWPLAFSEEGRKFAQAKGFAIDERAPGLLFQWLCANYPVRFKKDPIPSWERQVARLRSKGNPHVALENYAAFMEHTAQLREALDESAMAAEAEIDRLIDERRGK
ncbi:hypothetical protein [Rhizobium lentis]|uniref:Uncharacterized protein n=1 Tax=Rhizobium lentis TaxID=1138194 RepID=A0A9Q3M4H6_9HYPH|nr:hypothetical protein [Rhizobium lentis]MBX5021158.1 hypothetical protein [Rhizobium lentis]